MRIIKLLITAIIVSPSLFCQIPDLSRDDLIKIFSHIAMVEDEKWLNPLAEEFPFADNDFLEKFRQGIIKEIDKNWDAFTKDSIEYFLNLMQNRNHNLCELIYFEGDLDKWPDQYHYTQTPPQQKLHKISHTKMLISNLYITVCSYALTKKRQSIEWVEVTYKGKTQWRTYYQQYKLAQRIKTILYKYDEANELVGKENIYHDFPELDIIVRDTRGIENIVRDTIPERNELIIQSKPDFPVISKNNLNNKNKDKEKSEKNRGSKHKNKHKNRNKKSERNEKKKSP